MRSKVKLKLKPAESVDHLVSYAQGAWTMDDLSFNSLGLAEEHLRSSYPRIGAARRVIGAHGGIAFRYTAWLPRSM